MASGAWSDLAIRIDSRWAPASSLCPYVRAWRRYEITDFEPVDDVDGDEDDALLDCRHYGDLARFLRQRCPILIEHAENKEDEEAILESYVSWCDRCEHASSSDTVWANNVGAASGRGGFRGRPTSKARWGSNFFIQHSQSRKVVT